MDGNIPKQVKRYPGNVFKSFHSLEEAQAWVKPASQCPLSQSHLTSDANTHRGPAASTISPEVINSPVSSGSNKPPSSQTEETLVTELPEVVLSPEQTHVLNMVKSKRNVFFTGSAGRFRDYSTHRRCIQHPSNISGTGKSVLLRQIIAWARHGHENDFRVAVTASTGMAAVNIGGVTLHSWAGIGLGSGTVKHYVNSIGFGSGYWKKVRERWENVQTLIIDES